MLIFNARDPQYKSPIRAVATDEPVHLRLVVSRDMHCSGARLVVTKDGETLMPLRYVLGRNVRHGGRVLGAAFCRHHPGAVFLSF